MIRGFKVDTDCLTAFNAEQIKAYLHNLEDKYVDFKDMIDRKYEEAASEFTESFKSKLYEVNREPIVIHLKHPYIRPSGELTCVMILHIKGKGNHDYYYSGGKITASLEA